MGLTNSQVQYIGKLLFKKMGLINRQVHNLRKLILKQLKHGSDYQAGPKYEETVAQKTKPWV